MFAIIKTGGKQYKVSKDNLLRVDKLDGEAGDKIDFDQVLLVGGDKDTKTGAPLLEGAVVSAQIVEQTRDPKIIVFKKKRRQNYRRKQGHKQHKTIVKITDIKAA